MRYGILNCMDAHIKDILSDTHYDIRADGTVWTCIRKGPISSRKTGEWREIGSSCMNYKGYYHFKYHGRMLKTHRVIYAKFHGELIEGLTVDHVNGDRQDNRAENLQQITTQKNTRKGRNTKLSPADVVEIKRRRESGEGIKAIAKDFDIHHGTVSRIYDGKIWKPIE